MHLPGPLRAAVGLAATAADELKSLPDRAIELPMVAVSTALQLSLRAQQRYAQLSARGEQLLNGQTPGEQPPPWATFDEPATPDQLRRAALNQLDSLVDDTDGTDDIDGTGSEPDTAAPADSAGRHPSAQLFEELFGVSDPAAGSQQDADTGGETERATVTPIGRATGRTGATKKAARKTASKRAPAKKSTKPATKAAKAASRPASKTPAKKTPDAGDKQVSKPRDRAPSRFDDADPGDSPDTDQP